MSTAAWSTNAQSPTQPSKNEMEDLLSRLFSEGVGDKLEEMTYKPASTGNNKASSGSGKSSNMMGNGKDFFVELRKQVTALSEKEKAGG